MVQRRDDRCGHQFHEFLDGVGSVAVALNHLAQSRLTPPLPAARCRDSLGLQRSLHRPHWHPRGYFLEDALYHAHSSLIHKVARAVLVKPEAVLGRVARDELALAGFPQLPPARPFGCLRTLELGELVQYAVCKLPLRALVTPVIESPQSATVLRELLPQQVEVSRLAGEAVPILGQHDRDAAS